MAMIFVRVRLGRKNRTGKRARETPIRVVKNIFGAHCACCPSLSTPLPQRNLRHLTGDKNVRKARGQWHDAGMVQSPRASLRKGVILRSLQPRIAWGCDCKTFVPMESVRRILVAPASCRRFSARDANYFRYVRTISITSSAASSEDLELRGMWWRM